MKKRIEEMEYDFSESQVYLYSFGVLLFLEQAIRSALLWLWAYLNHILIIVVAFSAALTAAGLEAGGLSVTIALILFITQVIIGVVLFRAIATESKVKKVEEIPKVVVQNVQTVPSIPEVSESQPNVPMHTF